MQDIVLLTDVTQDSQSRIAFQDRETLTGDA
jgi:hypothetical protein